MIDAIPQALELIFTLEGILVLVLGTMLGIVLGARLGIGSTVAVAMILPLTLTMTQAPAILLLLTIYGGSISAILINTPGTRLTTDNPVLIAAIFSGFFIINLMLLPLGMLVSRVAAPLLRMREAYMLVVITMLCVVGVYFVRGNPFDLLVMAFAGIVGFLLRRQGYPMPPLVIGMVLGPTLEISLRQGLILTDGSFFAFFSGHPIAVALTIAALGMLILPVYRAISARRSEDAGITA